MTPEKYIAEVLPRLGGWCTAEKAKKIAELCSQKHVRLFCELGVFSGRSFYAGVLALNEEAIAIGVDPWRKSESVYGFDDANRDWWSKVDHEGIYRECLETQSLLGIAGKSFLIRATSEQALPLVKRLPPIDILHIDANHCEERSCFDVVAYGKLVPSGGIIVMDDCDWNTTKRAQEILSSVSIPLTPVEKWGVFLKK